MPSVALFEAEVGSDRRFRPAFEDRLGPERAEGLSLAIAARSLLGMLIFAFVTQEILGAGRLMPVSEEEITGTLAELFLHGVVPRAPGETKPC